MSDGAAFAYAWIKATFAAGKIDQAEHNRQMRHWRDWWIDGKRK